MSEVPIQVVIAAFEDEKSADQALSELKQAKWDGLIGIQNAAVLRRDKKNKLHIKETGDWGGGKGAVAGAVLGGFIGLVAGPVGWIGLTGAVIGGLAAKLRDSGFSNERLEKLGSSLTPGTSVIVAVIEHKWVADLENQMAEAGADVMVEELSADIAAQLEAGREVAYTALSTSDAVAVKRTSVGEHDADVSGFVLTEDGLVAGEAVITEEGVAAHRIVATEDGVAEQAVVATAEGAVVAGYVETDEGAVAGLAVVTPEEEEGEAAEAEA
ncbi:DUF1269 domain-containing protein [Chloroflexota bacterium]